MVPQVPYPLPSVELKTLTIVIFNFYYITEKKKGNGVFLILIGITFEFAVTGRSDISTRIYICHLWRYMSKLFCFCLPLSTHLYINSFALFYAVMEIRFIENANNHYPKSYLVYKIVLLVSVLSFKTCLRMIELDVPA